MAGPQVGDCYWIPATGKRHGMMAYVREVMLNQVRLARIQRGEVGAGNWYPLSVLREENRRDPASLLYEREIDGFGNYRGEKG